jgi:hypothetical protein
MGATVCFFLATALQCSTVSHVVNWPPAGTGAQLCDDVDHGFRCQNISRQDGLEIVRRQECYVAQLDLRQDPMPRIRIEDAKQALKFAKESLQSAEKQAEEFHQYDRTQDARWARKVAWVRDNVKQAEQALEAATKAEQDGRVNAQARISKWCIDGR